MFADDTNSFHTEENVTTFELVNLYINNNQIHCSESAKLLGDFLDEN